MINRELIRVKVIQLVYAYLQNADKTPNDIDKELGFSFSKTYDLYKYLLSLLVEVKRVAERKEEARILRSQRLGIADEDSSNDLILASNKLLEQLSQNDMLLNYIEREKSQWNDEDVIVKNLYNAFINSDIFAEYIRRNNFSYAADNELIRRLYKAYVYENELLDASIEEQGLYWNDDKINIDPYVVKTLAQFTETTQPDHELYPDFVDERDRQFAHNLLRYAVENSAQLQQYIKDHAQGWDFERIALMDIVIVQTALAEILSFGDIPLGVSINEYVELAKSYSTPRSASFVNGILDNISKHLRNEGILLKSAARAKK